MINQDRIRKCYLDTVTKSVKNSLVVFTKSMNGQVNLSSTSAQDGLAKLIVSNLNELELLDSQDELD